MIYDANGNKVRPMTALDRTIHLLMILCALLWLMFLASVALAQNVQLSPGPVLLTSMPQASPDSQRAVYADAAGLWSVPLRGGSPVTLITLLPGRQLFGAAQITPDGARVVFIADLDVLGKPELWSVPITGGSPTRISKAMAADRQVRDFLISPTSQRVYYVSDSATNNKMELWAVSIGGGPSIKLSHGFSTTTDVFGYQVSAQDVVVYRAGQSSGSGDFKLYGVRGDGLGSAREISRAMVSGGSVDATFKITQDGARVLYVADAEVNGEFNLYSVPINGGAGTRLNMDAGGVVGFSAESGPGGTRVVYEQRLSSVARWWSVPVTGGVAIEVPEPVAPPMTSPDGQWTLRSIGPALWSTGAEDTERRVSCRDQVVTTSFLAKPAYSITPDSQRVVYVASGEVWAGPISGAVCNLFSDGFESGGTEAWR